MLRIKLNKKFLKSVLVVELEETGRSKVTGVHPLGNMSVHSQQSLDIYIIYLQTQNFCNITILTVATACKVHITAHLQINTSSVDIDATIFTTARHFKAEDGEDASFKMSAVICEAAASSPSVLRVSEHL